MHQLFSNLFSNAIKFSKANVSNKISITSSLLSAEEAAALPVLKPGDRYYKIIFQDEGMGFSPEYSEQVFKSSKGLTVQNTSRVTE
jgi:signal transduction histidine kinase